MAMRPMKAAVVLAAAMAVFGCKEPMHEKAICMNDSTRVAQVAMKEVAKPAISSDTIPKKVEKKAESPQTKRKHFDLLPEKDYAPARFD